jgi:hypothetical protein
LSQSGCKEMLFISNFQILFEKNIGGLYSPLLLIIISLNLRPSYQSGCKEKPIFFAFQMFLRLFFNLIPTDFSTI